MVAEPASQTTELLLFVRCGDLYQPPQDGARWQVVELPAELAPGDLPGAVA